MGKSLSLRYLLMACMIFIIAAAFSQAQSSFPQTSMKAAVGGGILGASKSMGSLVLSSAGAGFDSPDFVFTLPADDILSVESKGARDGFLTFVLDPHSKFIAAYPSLVGQRSNTIQEQEHFLSVSLDPSEPVNTELTRAKAFQAFIKNHRAEREQAIVGGGEADSSTNAAHPSFGKTVHVAITNGLGGMHDGLLTFFPDRLQLDSPDVTIRMPVNQIVGLDPAGARETFLKVHYDPKSKFATAYRSYQDVSEQGTFLFVLSPQEAIAPAYKLAQDYTQYISAVRSGQEHATVNGAGSASEDAPAGPAPVVSPATEKRELARYDAGFLEHHNPGNSLLNGFKLINGIPGMVVVFDTGLGYVSQAQNPGIKPARQPFMQNGYLKFFVPQSAILSMRDVSVIRNQNTASTNSYIAEIDLDRNSNFYQQSKGLMTESDKDNRLFFTFKERYLLTQFLANAPRGAGAHDSF